MVRTTYAKQGFFMPGHQSKNDDVSKFRDKISKKLFLKKFSQINFRQSQTFSRQWNKRLKMAYKSFRAY